MPELSELLQQGADEARRLGFDEVELFALRQNSLSIKVFQQEVDTFSFSQNTGVSVRLFHDQRCGYAYTEEATIEALRKTIQSAAEVSAILPADEYQRLPDPGSQQYPTLSLLDHSFSELGYEFKIASARQIEKSAKESSKLVVNVPTASYGEGALEVALVSTRGLKARYHTNGGYLVAGVMAKRGKDVKSAYEVRYAKSVDRLSGSQVGRLAAEESIRRLKAKEVPSGPYSILFDPRTSRSLLSTFAGMFSAKNVQEGLSLLAGRLGDTIASPSLALRDNAVLPGGFASRPFDAEGMPSQDNVLISGGKLQRFLHNSYTAGKDGVATTGNAARGSVKGAVEVAPSNLYFERGHASRDELFTKTPRGLYIVQLDGLHSGANPVSGDFSLAAHGYYFAKGEIRYPVHQFTIAGNYLGLLSSVEGIGDDIEFSPPSGASSVGSPSLLVGELAVSGA